MARMFASMTEEAEAINWYEQRLAIEQDPDARKIIEDARHEEYKHFAMDFEFLLRKPPGMAGDRRGRPVPVGRHHGERRRAPRRAPRWSEDGGGASDGSLGIGEPEECVMSHLLRAHAPITERRLAGHRRRGPRARDPRVWPRAGPWTSAARTAGSSRPSASGASASASRGGRRRGSRRRLVQPLAEFRAPFSVDVTELPCARPRRGGRRLRRPRPRRALDRRRRERDGLPRQRRGRDHGITEATPHDPLSHDGRPETLPSLVASGVDDLMRPGSRARSRSC